MFCGDQGILCQKTTSFDGLLVGQFRTDQDEQ